MYSPVAAWFLEQLLGAELVAAGRDGAKLVIGVSASATLSVLLKDGSPGRIYATLQFANRGGDIEERVLEEKGIAALVGQLTLAATKRGVVPPNQTSKDVSLSIQKIKVGITPVETLKFATEYASHASGVKEMVMRCIDSRIAAVVTVPGGTLWIDLGANAMITTSTASTRPSRQVYSEGASVDYRTYKWKGTSGYLETVQACKAVLTEVFKIVR